PSPYTSAVSKNVTPVSAAASSTSRASSSLRCPQSAPNCHVPRPMTETSRPVRPRIRFSTAAPSLVPSSLAYRRARVGNVRYGEGVVKQRAVRMWVAVGIVAAALTVSGCESLGGPSPDTETPAPTKGAPTVYEGDGAADLDLAPVELQGAPAYAEADRSEVVGLASGRLLATRPGPENIIGVDAWDAGSGELSWDITTYESYQIVLDHGFGRGLLEFAGGAVQRGDAEGYVVPIFGNLCGG